MSNSTQSKLYLIITELISFTIYVLLKYILHMWLVDTHKLIFNAKGNLFRKYNTAMDLLQSEGRLKEHMISPYFSTNSVTFKILKTYFAIYVLHQLLHG